MKQRNANERETDVQIIDCCSLIYKDKLKLLVCVHLYAASNISFPLDSFGVDGVDGGSRKAEDADVWGRPLLCTILEMTAEDD